MRDFKLIKPGLVLSVKKTRALDGRMGGWVDRWMDGWVVKPV